MFHKLFQNIQLIAERLYRIDLTRHVRGLVPLACYVMQGLQKRGCMGYRMHGVYPWSVTDGWQ